MRATGRKRSGRLAGAALLALAAGCAEARSAQTEEPGRGGYSTAVLENLNASGREAQMLLHGPDTVRARVRSADLLAALPDGEFKRRFVLDCTGCHTYARLIERQPDRSREDWARWIGAMLSFAGADKRFPIISASRDAEATAAWLAEHAGSVPPAPAVSAATLGRAAITEYDLPEPRDLAHDLALDPRGHVIVTGMMRHVLYDLDPESGEVIPVPIPVRGANPRAVEVDGSGAWWALLGMPGKVARYTPATGEWTSWDVGMYGHDVVLAGDGKVWTNGHFTKSPERIARLDPATGAVDSLDVPTPPMADGGSTIPYGFRAGPDGTLWMTQLAGNRLVRFSPASGEFRLYDLPTTHSGPRRLDVAADGTVWIPQYAAGKLARFDPVAERFTEYDFPTRDALPYIARVDPRTGAVWVATAASNTIARFEPASGRWTEYPLPQAEAMVRHIAIDPRTGTVWGAYSPSPSDQPARVFRLVPEN